MMMLFRLNPNLLMTLSFLLNLLMDWNKSIEFLNWNARSLFSNEDEFFNFLRTHNIDVAVITETFLKPCHSLKSDPNYKIYRNDRLKGAGRGVAIAIRGRIKHKLLPSFNTRVIETLGIEIEINMGKFIIIVAYLPFQCNGEQNIFFKGDLQKFTRNKTKFFIIGDFNSKHRSWNNLYIIRWPHSPYISCKQATVWILPHWTIRQ